MMQTSVLHLELLAPQAMSALTSLLEQPVLHATLSVMQPPSPIPRQTGLQVILYMCRMQV